MKHYELEDVKSQGLTQRFDEMTFRQLCRR